MIKIHKLISLILIIISFTSCNYFKGNSNEIKLFPVKIDNKFQYINSEGKIIITPQFSDATIFRDGLALVKLIGDEQLFGFIDEEGKFAIPANYLSATVFNDGIAWVVTKNSAPSAIDTKGNILFNLQDAESVNNFHEGFAAYSTYINGEICWGFVNKEGKVIIPPQFSDTRYFKSSMCAVQNKEGKWGFLNNDGIVKINYQFEFVGDFENGNAVVYNSSNKAGIIDLDGKYVINPQYDYLEIDGDRIMCNQNNKLGWIDKSGKYLINPQFESSRKFGSNNLAAVKIGEKFAYVDLNGKIEINPQFEQATAFNGNFAFVNSGGKIGIIDKEGKFVVNPQFDDVSEDFNDYINLHNVKDPKFESIESNYLNTTLITDVINILNPKGIPLLSPFSSIQKKYNLLESNISQYTNWHQLETQKKISKFISYNLNVFAVPFTDVPDGWYYKKVFNSKSPIDGYLFTCTLSGNKYYGRGYDIKTAFESTYIGYKKVNDESNSYVSVFKKNNLVIKTCASLSEIYIFSYNENNKILNDVISSYISSISYSLVANSKLNFTEMDAAKERAMADSIAAAQADSISNAAMYAADTPVMY